MTLTRREAEALARWRPGKNNLVNRTMKFFCINLSKFVLTKMNSLEIQGAEKFEALMERGRRGLLTFSNHTALFDDPLLPSNFRLGKYDDVRWVAADALNFFSTWPTAFVFSAGKGVPVARGAGFDQPGFHFLRDRLKEGHWVHIFPEGGRTRREDGLLSEEFRPGVGRLIAETKPIGLPFYHYGMHDVLPIGAKVPRWGKEVRLAFGDAIDFTEELVSQIAGTDEDTQRGHGLWDALTGYAYEALSNLERAVRPTSPING